MNRRLFLLRTLLMTSVFAARPRIGWAMGRERILVIGAGMAGVSAARKLSDAGFDVIILEARAEVGGRIRQDSTFGLPLDLGASFITTSEGNPLLPLARKYAAATYDTDLDETGYVDQDGNFFRAKITDRATKLYERFREEVSEAGESLNEDQAVEELLSDFLEKVQEEEGEVVSELINFLAVSDITGDYAADPSETSTLYFQNDGEFSGPDLMVTSGYRKILDGLANGLQIKTEVTVKKVSYSSTGVSVETSAGSFDADRVIITVPLGILKKGNIEFSPPLPKDKTIAIERLGMGLLNKLYLKFPSSFWKTDDSALGYFGNVKSLGGKEYPDFYLLDRALKMPIALLFVGGSQAHAFEKLSKQVLVDKAMQTLKRVYGGSIPNPIGSLATSWGTDPHVYGSYSFAAVGSGPRDYDALAEPIHSRLFFAGEATHRKYSASVHGAYLSGLREADRLLELLS